MNITLDEIRSKAPPQATHYIKIDGFVIYVMKKRFWHRWMNNGEFSQWIYYKPSILFKLFRIKPL